MVNNQEESKMRTKIIAPSRHKIEMIRRMKEYDKKIDLCNENGYFPIFNKIELTRFERLWLRIKQAFKRRIK